MGFTLPYSAVSKQKLNLGCGSDIRAGYVNVDIVELPGVDVVHDLSVLPLPFADGSASEIICQDVLEHMEYIPILEDLYRVLEPGGVLKIRVPHFTSRNNFVDPTHQKYFSVETFSFFTKESEREYYFSFAFSRIRSCRITFEHWSRWLFWNRFVEPIVNSSYERQRLYEATGWSRLFPAENIEIVIER